MVLNRLLQSVTTWGMWRNNPTPTSFQGLTTPVTPIPARLCIWTPPQKAPALEKTCVTLCVAINIAMLTCTGTSEPWKVPAADVYFAEWVCSPFSAATMFISSLTLPSAGVTQQRVGEKKNGISEAVDPLVRHRSPVWTLQLHTWDIQNQPSGKQQGSALSCSRPSSAQAGPLTSHSTSSVNGSCHTALDPAIITLRQSVPLQKQK